MNLQENILRVKELMGLNENFTEKKLYHLSRYPNRESIRKKGLIPSIGQKTANWNVNDSSPDQTEKYIYLMKKPTEVGKALFGFDVWEIDISNLNLDLKSDPNHPESDNYLVTKSHIPANALTLIDSNKEGDDYYINVEKHGFPKREEPDEPETQEEPETGYFDLSKLDPNITVSMDDLEN